MEFLTDIWRYLIQRKKFWLLPVILILMFLGLLMLIGASGTLAPFIYTLF